MSFLLSDGVQFLLPELRENPDTALGRDRRGGFAGWRLQGVAWSSDRPCYVFIKTMASSGRQDLLRIWVDQDVLLIRGWAIVTPMEDGREKIVVECDYHEINVNGRLPVDIFQLKPPEPLERPVGTDAREENTEPSGDQP